MWVCWHHLRMAILVISVPLSDTIDFGFVRPVEVV